MNKKNCRIHESLSVFLADKTISTRQALFYLAKYFFALLLAFFPSQICADILQLGEFVTQTIKNSPQRMSIQSTFEEALAEGESLALKRNPQISTQVLRAATSPRDLEKYQGSVTLSQPIRPSDLGARNKAADILQRQAQAVRNSELIDLSYDIALLYTSIWQAQTLSHEFNTLAKRGARLRKLLSEAVSKGLVPPGRFALFEAELGALRAEAFRAQGMRASAHADLQLYGAEKTSLLGTVTPDIPRLPKPTELIRNNDTSIPSLLHRLQLSQQFAQAAATVAERDRLPAMTPSLTYQYSPDDIHQVGVGLSFPLPFFNPNKPLRTTREAQQKRASASAEVLTTTRWQHVVTSTLQAATLRRTELKTYEEEVLPKLEKAFDQFEQAVRQGGGELFDLWQVLRALREMKTEVVRARREALVQHFTTALLAGYDIYGVTTK
jgi:hypothetical protein